MSPVLKNDRYAYCIKEVVKLFGLSRSSIYRAIDRGELRTHKIGGRTLITPTDLESLLRTSAARPPREPSVYIEVIEKLELRSRPNVWLSSRRKN